MNLREGNYDVDDNEDYWGNDTGFVLLFNKHVIYKEDFPETYQQLFNFILSLKGGEYNYFRLLNQGWKPQQARAVLPTALKTELVMTGFTSDWEHFFELRCDSAAHPSARELAIPLREKFKSLNLWESVIGQMK